MDEDEKAKGYMFWVYPHQRKKLENEVRLRQKNKQRTTRSKVIQDLIDRYL